MNAKPRGNAFRRGLPADYAKTRGLRPQREARLLVNIGRTADGRAIKLAPRAAAAWQRMRVAALQSGIDLVPVSGFRSVARQVKIVRAKLAAGKTISEILHYVAAPGFSEHHTGRALDLGTPGETTLEETFARTPAFRWLKRHAPKFSFRLSYPRRNPHGIAYEPWHWCWVGRGRAEKTKPGWTDLAEKLVAPDSRRPRL